MITECVVNRDNTKGRESKAVSNLILFDVLMILSTQKFAEISEEKTNILYLKNTSNLECFSDPKNL